MMKNEVAFLARKLKITYGKGMESVHSLVYVSARVVDGELITDVEIAPYDKELPGVVFVSELILESLDESTANTDDSSTRNSIYRYSFKL